VSRPPGAPPPLSGPIHALTLISDENTWVKSARCLSKESLGSFGSGYGPGMPLTGPGTGIASGATATIVVLGGQVSSCMITAGANGINSTNQARRSALRPPRLEARKPSAQSPANEVTS
jgi:hypothetical protein